MRRIIRYVHLLALLPLCHCGVQGTGDMAGIPNTPLVDKRSGREDHLEEWPDEPQLQAVESNGPVERQRPPTNTDEPDSFRSDFPCPSSVAILPCVCTVDENHNINLDCTEVESEEQLTAVFLQEFPVEDLHQFSMANNSAVKVLSNFMNGVTFQSLYLSPGPFALEAITDYFLMDMRDTLKNIEILYSKLTSDFFPFLLLPLMDELETLHIHGSDIAWIPPIRPPPKLSYLGVDNSRIEHLVNGSISIRPGQMTIQLHGNGLLTIEPGSFTIPYTNDSVSVYLSLHYNQLTVVEESVFGELMPYLSILYLNHNPLSCACDIAWLVLDPPSMAKVDPDATCEDGTNLHDLDPIDYEDFC